MVLGPECIERGEEPHNEVCLAVARIASQHNIPSSAQRVDYEDLERRLDVNCGELLTREPIRVATSMVVKPLDERDPKWSCWRGGVQRPPTLGVAHPSGIVVVPRRSTGGSRSVGELAHPELRGIAATDSFQDIEIVNPGGK